LSKQLNLGPDLEPTHVIVRREPSKKLFAMCGSHLRFDVIITVFPNDQQKSALWSWNCQSQSHSTFRVLFIQLLSETF